MSAELLVVYDGERCILCTRCVRFMNEVAVLNPELRELTTLFGAVEISCAGGKRCFGPGDVMFAEDLTGEGHANRELLGPRESLIIPVADDFDIKQWAVAP
jgi:hypothetical protein